MFIFNLIGKTANGEKHVYHCYANSEDEMMDMTINWIASTNYVEREKIVLDYKREA